MSDSVRWRSLRTWLLWIAVVIGAGGACHERPATRFPHDLHLAHVACQPPRGQDCLTCLSCHQNRATPEPTTAELEDCSGCHRQDRSDQLLASLGPIVGPEAPGRRIRFSHSAHLKMKGINGQCVSCHAGAVDRKGTLFPPMARCLECHEHAEQFQANQCGPCHEPKDLVKLEPVSFLSHDLAWFRHHGEQARANGERCETCHTQPDCQVCHDLTQGIRAPTRYLEAEDKSFVHGPDFLTRHAIEARSQTSRCGSCHEPSTCDACHLERGVSGNLENGRNPHPPGWVGGNPASLQFHGQAARRDLLSCAGCHDQGPATNCIRCHQVGGSGGNPHPDGWRTSRTPESAMCRFCHER